MAISPSNSKKTTGTNQGLEQGILSVGLSFQQLKELMTHMRKEGITSLTLGEGENLLALNREINYVMSDVGMPEGSTGNFENFSYANSGMGVQEAVEETVIPPVYSGHEVVSPVVGVFYEAPSPDQPAFVEIGSYVKKGDVLCIVEAMKLMNEVTSPISGVVVDILVDNASRVEFGQKIFHIDPKGSGDAV